MNSHSSRHGFITLLITAATTTTTTTATTTTSSPTLAWYVHLCQCQCYSVTGEICGFKGERRCDADVFLSCDVCVSVVFVESVLDRAYEKDCPCTATNREQLASIELEVLSICNFNCIPPLKQTEGPCRVKRILR
jgi:hypothetical protein